VAGTSISVSADGFERIDAMLSRLVNPDFTELLESIGGMVETQTDVRIKTQKASPDGTKWPELSPEYKKRKKKGGILELEGDLRISIVSLVTGQTSVEVGTNLVYAATHQFGDPSRNIPQREFLGLSPDNEEAINRLLEEWFAQQTAAA
jgi:phage virion morphogenesis protein